ncbi:MAG: apolipoprotein N-acyltransferase [Aquificaceae bacterium]|nr:apolipoprotein N-acyltransferase [Aquificaceae bacterium]
MRNNPHKPLFRKIALSFLTGFLLYLPFSKQELWFLALPALILLFRFREGLFWFLSGSLFFFLSLRCAGIAAVEFGGVSPLLFQALFIPLVFFLSFYQFYAPLKLWQKLSGRIIWTLPLFYAFFEFLRSHFPYGGFPWLILGSLSPYIPLVRDSLLYANVYLQSLLFLFTALFLYRKKLKALALLWSAFALLGFLALLEKGQKLRFAESLRVALVQTAVPQRDKLNRDSFKRHAQSILELLEEAVRREVDLIVLPESALHFFYSEEEETNMRLRELSLKKPILVGLVDLREGLRPYNSAYLFSKGIAVDYYDKVRLFPVGEYMPKPFGFLKDFFPSIEGIDYVPGERLRPLEYKNMRIATAICFEVAYHNLVKKLSERANLIAVLTNDGWFKDSDCTHQHYLWARVRALENGRYLLWVNNSGDTGVIDPYGRVLSRMPYMKRGISSHEVKLIP